MVGGTPERTRLGPGIGQFVHARGAHHTNRVSRKDKAAAQARAGKLERTRQVMQGRDACHARRGYLALDSASDHAGGGASRLASPTVRKKATT
jgi:hypothetical protein